MLTETAEDHITSAYDDEDAYYASSQNPINQTGHLGQTNSGSYISQSYLTKNSKSMRQTNLDQTMAEDFESMQALARLKERIKK